MRDVKMKPINIEPVKIILLIGLASAVMGLSACNKSDSHKTVQTPNIASAPSEDVKVAEQISEQIPEQITEQALQNHSNAPIDAQKVSVTAETADDIKKRCRALLSETEDQKTLKRACYAELKAFRDTEKAAQEARLKALNAQIAAKKAQRAENAKTIAALDAELAEKAKTIAALDAENAAVKARRAENAKAYAALKAENEQKRIRNDALLRDIARKAAQGSK